MWIAPTGIHFVICSRLRKFMLKFYYSLIVILLSIPLHAQTLPGEQEFQSWDGATLVHLTSSRLTLQEGQGQKTQDINLASGTYAEWRTDYFEGAVWTSLRQDKDGKPSVLLFKSQKGKNPELIAWCPEKLEQGRVNRVHPIGQDRFLLVSSRVFSKDKKISFLATARVNRDGKLEFMDLLEVDIGEKFFEGIDPAAPEKDFIKFLYLAGYLSKWVRGRDHLAFIQPKVGRIFLVDINSLKTRYVKIFSDHPDADAWTQKMFATEHTLLGFQPAGDGHFVLATRTQEAMLKAREAEKLSGVASLAIPSTGNPSRDREAVKQAQLNPRRIEQASSAQSVGLMVYPEILWWDLDPESGKVTRRIPNPGIPESITQLDRLKKFKFRLNYQGDILMD